MTGTALLAARIFLGFTLLVILLHTVVRVVRRFYKFPMPPCLANVIDNPLRRKIQPPAETAIRHGLEPGMVVLEVGPGSGTYTLAAAHRVGEHGRIVTVDIEPRIAARVLKRAQQEQIRNVDVLVADVHELPFGDGFFDVVYMIAVIGEIPAPEGALKEFHRVLSPSGALVFSELLFDPDYPRAETLVRQANAAGFQLRKRGGSFLYYTLSFEKTP